MKALPQKEIKIKSKASLVAHDGGWEVKFDKKRYALFFAAGALTKEQREQFVEGQWSVLVAFGETVARGTTEAAVARDTFDLDRMERDLIHTVERFFGRTA